MGDLDFRQKRLPDGRMATVYPLIFGRGRLGVSLPQSPDVFEDEW